MPRKDILGRRRRPEQDATTFQPARPGRLSRSHNINMSPEAHEAFARLSPQERGDLLELVLSSAKSPRQRG